MAFFHGVKATESPTGILAPASTESGMIFAVGTATKEDAPVNKPVLCYSYDEAVNAFGYSADFDNYTLNEVISSQFVLHKAAPIVFVNVLDKDKHSREVKGVEVEGIVNTPAILDAKIFSDSLEVTSKGGTETIDLVDNVDYTATVQVQSDPAQNYYQVDIMVGVQLPSDDLILGYDDANGNSVTVAKHSTDFPFDLPVGASNVSLAAEVEVINNLVRDVHYTAEYNSDEKLVITLIDSSLVTDDKVFLRYLEFAPDLVTAEDIIGGVDLVTGENKGLECIEDVYPKFRLTVGQIIAPKFSTDETVAAVMKAKTQNINGVFSAIALVDIPTDTVKNYTDAAEYKNRYNLIDANLIVCYPKVSLGGVQYHLSTQLASLINIVDADNDDIPYVSPSNHRLQMDSTVLADGTESFYSIEKANYLNGQGITTALNFSQGWVAWGNRTSLYPSSTDVKDVFIPVRRMFNWLKNTLILTYWQKVDAPVNKRLIESIEDSVNIWLNGLTAKGAILGGRVEFFSKDNPTTDLLNGIVRFKVYFTPCTPAEQLIFDVEFDPDYFSVLFE